MPDITKEIEQMADKLSKSEDTPSIVDVIMDLGPEGLRKALPNLTDSQKILLKSVLEDMQKSHTSSLQDPGYTTEPVINTTPTGDYLYNEEVKMQQDEQDEEVAEETKKKKQEEIRHQGGVPVEGWEGQVIKSELKKGEGSRGGKIIGHTKSGKPIYDTYNHPTHSGFDSSDHQDAEKHHAESSKAALASGDYKQANRHTESAMMHSRHLSPDKKYNVHKTFGKSEDMEVEKENGKKEAKIEVSAKDMVDEHEKLVDVLESEDRKDDKKEAKKQKKELEEYKDAEKMSKSEEKQEDNHTNFVKETILRMQERKLKKSECVEKLAEKIGCETQVLDEIWDELKIQNTEFSLKKAENPFEKRKIGQNCHFDVDQYIEEELQPIEKGSFDWDEEEADAEDMEKAWRTKTFPGSGKRVYAEGPYAGKEVGSIRGKGGFTQAALKEKAKAKAAKRGIQVGRTSDKQVENHADKEAAHAKVLENLKTNPIYADKKKKPIDKPEDAASQAGKMAMEKMGVKVEEEHEKTLKDVIKDARKPMSGKPAPGKMKKNYTYPMEKCNLAMKKSDTGINDMIEQKLDMDSMVLKSAEAVKNAEKTGDFKVLSFTDEDLNKALKPEELWADGSDGTTQDTNLTSSDSTEEGKK